MARSTNILLVNDDGPDAVGLTVLANAIRAVYNGARLITLAPISSLGGQSMAVTCVGLHTFDIQQVRKDCYTVDAKPADLIYLAGAHREKFLRSGRFDLVVSGLNHGANVGMDVLHSGTVGMAMVAASYWGIGAVAFSKHLNWPHACDESACAANMIETERHVCAVLQGLIVRAGQCFNINFPIQDPKGVKHCKVGRHSRFQPLQKDSHKRPGLDVWELERGYITISRLRPVSGDTYSNTTTEGE